jgi:hypothetical protein
MSTGRRAYDLLRGYVNREWERIRGLEPPDSVSAAGEIDEAMRHPSPRSSSVSSPVEVVDEDSFDIQERARRVLGVTVETEFHMVRRTFERLNKRSDPGNFPIGSPEAMQAAMIQRRVQEAYRILTAEMDASELRFRSLEIE